MKKNNNKIRIATIVIIILGLFIIFSTNWLLANFGGVSVEEIVFTLKVPLKGTDMTTIYKFILNVLLKTIISIETIYYLIIKDYDYELKIKNIKIYPINKILKLVISIIFTLSAIYYFFNSLDLFNYIKCQLTDSILIEKEYVDPDKTKITFPDEKRNLIYIYLESMESSYTSIENGGIRDNDLIPELRKLADENINFSNTNRLGGAQSTYGATWTVGAMVAQTSGLPLKIELNYPSYGKKNTYLENYTTLGDILYKQGYNQEIIMGSDSLFSARKEYFEKHGNYKVWDLSTAIEEKKMTEDEKVFWGFEDKNLFEWSKEELLKLSQENKPFNFTILTVDTHFEDGYLSEDCEKKYKDQYSNVIACSSNRTYKFIEWIKQQKFYENTTIIITGDHLTMDSDFYDGIDEKYIRTGYNAFINSAQSTTNTNNRIFTTLDMYPTTLAAIGAEIEEERLGLGTNLFSDKKTLAEKYGIEKLNNELRKNSNFYDNKFNIK